MTAFGLDRRDANRIRSGLGYLPQDFAVLPDLTAAELCEFSGGMKQRVGIAQALLADPRLLKRAHRRPRSRRTDSLPHPPRILAPGPA